MFNFIKVIDQIINLSLNKFAYFINEVIHGIYLDNTGLLLYGSKRGRDEEEDEEENSAKRRRIYNESNSTENPGLSTHPSTEDQSNNNQDKGSFAEAENKNDNYDQDNGYSADVEDQNNNHDQDHRYSAQGENQNNDYDYDSQDSAYHEPDDEPVNREIEETDNEDHNEGDVYFEDLRLIRKVEDTNFSEDERQIALDELREKYPHFFDDGSFTNTYKDSLFELKTYLKGEYELCREKDREELGSEADNLSQYSESSDDQSDSGDDFLKRPSYSLSEEPLPDDNNLEESSSDDNNSGSLLSTVANNLLDISNNI